MKVQSARRGLYAKDKGRGGKGILTKHPSKSQSAKEKQKNQRTDIRVHYQNKMGNSDS